MGIKNLNKIRQGKFFEIHLNFEKTFYGFQIALVFSHDPQYIASRDFTTPPPYSQSTRQSMPYDTSQATPEHRPTIVFAGLARRRPR